MAEQGRNGRHALVPVLAKGGKSADVVWTLVPDGGSLSSSALLRACPALPHSDAESGRSSGGDAL
jgi:hypothetical protein